MNVDEAMAYASKDKCFWAGDVHTALETLVAEVKKLRAELAMTQESMFGECYINSLGNELEELRNENSRLKAELAEVKADRDSWRRVCEKETEAKHQAWAELAAAKAASVVPVGITDLSLCGGGQRIEFYVEGDKSDGAKMLTWLRDRMKERGEG